MKKTTKPTKKSTRVSLKKGARSSGPDYKMSTESANYKLVNVHFTKNGYKFLTIGFMATCSDILDESKARATAKTIIQWVEEFLGSPITEATYNELNMAMNFVCRSSDNDEDLFVENRKKVGFKINSMYCAEKNPESNKLYTFAVVRC